MTAPFKRRILRCSQSSRLALVLVIALAPVPRVEADGDALHVLGYVRDHLGNSLAGINVLGDDYVGHVQVSTTDENGHFEIEVEPEVNLRVRPSCEQLATLGFACPPPATVTASADDIEVEFILHPAAALEVTTATLPKAHPGVGYATHLSATGGSPPYAWQLSANSILPDGLVLASDGRISGIPGSTGKFEINVQVTDSVSATGSRGIELIVQARPVLSAIFGPGNLFSVRVTGASNQTYIVQVSTNSALDSWTALAATNHPVADSFLVSDPQSTSASRFYRVLAVP
ncbi:MAG TPA: putative Ig domain-containing protein [Verrucomicrobiae bacterium]|nr:putative Ig domain-containing protein [Verrucomicrobiae bacterium]